MTECVKKKLVESVTSLPGYTSAAGTRVLHVKAGSVHMALGRKPELLQFNGFYHGAVISGLADHAAGAAVTTALPDGLIAVTVNLHVHFLSPADGESIVAKAKVIKVGKTLSVASVDVVTVAHGKERVCAIATVTLRAVHTPASLPIQEK